MANYAHIENGTITGLYDLLPTNWRNISNFFALENETEYLRSLGWRQIVKDETPIDSNTHYPGEPTYNIVDSEVVETIPQYTVQPVNTAALHISAMVYLRQKRDKLLKETDFSQLADVITVNGPELSQAYMTYRQQLRDLPSIYENDMNFIDESTARYPSLILPNTTTSTDNTTTETPPEGV